MPHNNRSRHITHGVARAPNRSMYYAMGYDKADFEKPMVGVANSHSTITPCNSGLQKLADAAIAAIAEAGGNPQVFGTPTISDGMSMGTEGMKYSLVSREVIADSVELTMRGHCYDALVGLAGGAVAELQFAEAHGLHQCLHDLAPQRTRILGAGVSARMRRRNCSAGAGSATSGSASRSGALAQNDFQDGNSDWKVPW